MRLRQAPAPDRIRSSPLEPSRSGTGVRTSAEDWELEAWVFAALTRPER